MAAPVRGDLLLTTYDCIHPLGEYEFYFESGGQIQPLKLWAADPWLNLAILKADPPTFTPVRWENPETVSKNQALAPVKRPTEAAPPRVVVTETSLSLETNPNSGVLCVHEYGGLLGVTSPRSLPPGAPLFGANSALRAIAVGLQSESADPLSLCIPVDATATRAIAALVEGEPLAYGFLGLEPASASELPGGQGAKGVYARQVTDHSPAKLAGIREENPRTGEVDLITKVNDLPVETTEELLLAVGRLAFGDQVRLTVKRGKIADESPPLQIECTLAKRYASSARPLFAQKPKLVWRGVSVDYFTAIDDFAARARLVDPAGCVVIAGVEPDSAAWKAGLRRGMFLSKINDQRIRTEAEFHEAAKPLTGAVKFVTTSRADGLRIEPQTYELAP